MKVNFNSLGIDNGPLSQYLNTPAWGHSPLGTLHEESQGSVYLVPLRGAELESPLCWKVVYAVWSPEDTTMTRFRAYGSGGEHLPYTDFGVHYDNMPHDRKHIQGSFRYPPEYGSDYIWVTDNQFHAQNIGGYQVQVLDTRYPSERMAFGFGKFGDQHQALVIAFRLFANI